LEWVGTGWRMGFFAKHEGLEWLLAAVARSGAELIAEGSRNGLQTVQQSETVNFSFTMIRETQRRKWCSMALCGNRSKVAAFARRHGGEKVRAQHALVKPLLLAA